MKMSSLVEATQGRRARRCRSLKTLRRTGATTPTVLLAILVLVATSCLAEDAPQRATREHVLQLLAEVPLIDGHNDVPWTFHERLNNHLGQIDFKDTTALDPPMHTDLARLAASGIGGQFWSVYIPASLDGPGAARAVLEQIDVVHRLVERYPEHLELALSSADITRAHAAGRIASLIGMEGGHSMENSLGVLRQLYRAGARYMTLTHSSNVAWADSATDEPEHGGLTEFGTEVVREMNRMGMLVDLSHVSPDTMNDVLDVTEAPIIFSHSSARGVTNHPRNVPDGILERMPENGGVVMVTFVPSFISEANRTGSNVIVRERRRLQKELDDEDEIREALRAFAATQDIPPATLQDAADHIDHIRNVAGIDHVGIGSDFDGISSVPQGLEDVSRIPDLFVELVRRGYSDDDLQKIAGGNLLRALREAERVSWKLQAERPASDALIWELDGGEPEKTVN